MKEGRKGYVSGTNDRSHLLSIFPEEIWLLVLEKLRDDHTDLTSICNASCYFRCLLLPERVVFLFPAVWEVLGMKYEQEHKYNSVYNETIKLRDEGEWGSVEGVEVGDNHYDDDGEEDDMRENNGSIQDDDERTCWFKGILNLRLTCRTWNAAVDNFYQKLSQHYKMENNDTCLEGDLCLDYLGWSGVEDDHEMKEHWANLEFSQMRNPDLLDEFLQHFEKTHYVNSVKTPRNPFLARKVVIEYCSQFDVEFLNQLSRLLKKYGHHIWYCVMRTHDDFQSRGAYYAKLKEYLELMPNLKVLEIQYTQQGYTSFRDIFMGNAAVYSDQEIAQMQHETEVHPLPKFEDLKFLKITHLPVPIFNELIRKNSHISILNIFGDPEYGIYDIAATDLPNLDKLSIKYFAQNDFYKLCFVCGICFFLLCLFYWGMTWTSTSFELPGAHMGKYIDHLYGNYTTNT